MLKVIEHRLTGTRTKVSKKWQSYRSKKRHIRSLKRLAPDQKRMRIASELDLTRQKISQDWTRYREAKHAVIYKSPYADFSFVRTLTGMTKNIDGKKHFFKFHDSTQKIYKAKKNFDVERLDTIVPELLANRKVKGVLIVFEVTSEETGQRHHVSNYINAELMDIITERGETVYEYVVKRFQAGSTKDYQLHFIYMRVIYAKENK